ncbi:magnesium and cobalt transport protein CorA [Umezawaea tangerina]|uniref:Magnesium transporter n=1 Tax=Umezawaea tangerina TaxID=84725 RepID=A0A2T0SZK8_9PSEU|nr:magnesium and cobalt transport protein CorA [Umezawaea tangerina]PRY38793.1 magnesium transporter [Umezawaea tangerina]
MVSEASVGGAGGHEDDVVAKVASAVVGCAVYVGGERLAGEWSHGDALAEVRERRAGFVWLGLFEPSVECMREVAATFGLHARAVQAAVGAYQRPKLEYHDGTVFMVLKTVRHVEHESPTTANEIVETGEVMAFVGADFVVTVRHGVHSSLRGLRAELEGVPERLAVGPSAVLHAIAAHVVDSYLSVTSAFEGDIDTIEALVFAPDAPVEAEQMYLMKREIVELNRSVTPLATLLKALCGTESALVPDDVRSALRDLDDRLAVVAAQVTAFDELLTSLLYATLAKVQLQQNNDMRKISAWAAIIAVPTLLVGVYGMNFEHMPELGWEFGYYGVLGVIAVGCLVLHRSFKRNRWL